MRIFKSSLLLFLCTGLQAMSVDEFINDLSQRNHHVSEYFKEKKPVITCKFFPEVLTAQPIVKPTIEKVSLSKTSAWTDKMWRPLIDKIMEDYNIANKDSFLSNFVDKSYHMKSKPGGEIPGHNLWAKLSFMPFECQKVLKFDGMFGAQALNDPLLASMVKYYQFENEPTPCVIIMRKASGQETKRWLMDSDLKQRIAMARLVGINLAQIHDKYRVAHQDPDGSNIKYDAASKQMTFVDYLGMADWQEKDPFSHDLMYFIKTAAIEYSTNDDFEFDKSIFQQILNALLTGYASYFSKKNSISYDFNKDCQVELNGQ